MRTIRRQVEIGSLAPLEVTTAEAQVAATQSDVVDSQINLAQQELQLKNLISRIGLADPVLAGARIVPVDRIAMPEKDDLPPLKELVQKALANRSDLAAEKAGLNTAEVSALGTRNGVLPALQAFGGESQAGLGGNAHTVTSWAVENRILTLSAAWATRCGRYSGAIFRRSGSVRSIASPIAIGRRRRITESTSFSSGKRSSEPEGSQPGGRGHGELVVALRQARARYDAAVEESDPGATTARRPSRRNTALGASTPYNVIQQQRDLATAQSAEIAALVSYNNARIALDQTLGHNPRNKPSLDRRGAIGKGGADVVTSG